MRFSNVASIPLAIVAFATSGAAQCEIGRLVPLDQAPGDLLGTAIAVDGDLALVGAAHKDGDGAAYLFERVNAGWVQRAKLTASDGEQGDLFGAAVALSGDTAVIGAPGEGTGGALAGAAYVFEGSGTLWGQVAKLKAPAPQAFAEFGTAVAVQFNFALVGAPGEDGAAPGSGAVHSFVNGFGGWTGLQTVVDPDGQADDRFGTALAFDGASLLVGAPNDDGAASNGGALHLWQQGAVMFFPVAELIPNDLQPFDRLGTSVALDGTRLMAGAPFADGAQPTAGAVYVFEPGIVGWLQVARLFAVDGGTADGFGVSMALAGDRLLVGGPRNVAVLAGEGFAYSFQRAGIDWVQTGTYLAEDGQFLDGFGGAVGLHAREFLVGSASNDSAGSEAGAVYRFSADGAPAVYCTAKTTSGGCTPAISASGRPKAGGAFIVRVAGVEPNQLAVVFYGTTGAVGLPFQGGFLCVQPPVARLAPQSSGGSGACTGALAVDFSAWIAGGADPALVPGQQVWLQGWFRDPGAASGTGLSNGLTTTVCN